MRYLTGRDLLARWGIEGFQLCELLMRGLQAYSRFGKKIILKNSPEANRRLSVEEIFQILKEKQGDYSNWIVKLLIRLEGQKRLTDEQLLVKAVRIYSENKVGVRVKPSDAHVADFDLSLNEDIASEQIRRAMACRFKIEDVLRFEKEESLLQKLVQELRDISHVDKKLFKKQDEIEIVSKNENIPTDTTDEKLETHTNSTPEETSNKKENPSKEALRLECVKVGNKFGEEALKMHGMPPTNEEIDAHIKAELEKMKETLGKNKSKILPREEARTIRKMMDDKYRRPQGQKNFKNINRI